VAPGVSFSMFLNDLWHVIAMISTVVAYQPPHGAASAAGSGTHWFAIGLLVGILVWIIAPGWVKGLVITFDLVAVGWSTGILNYSHSSHGRWVPVAVLGIIVGIAIGMYRGLRALSEHEYLTRLGGMKTRGWWPFS
jgi:hypothetical protein